MPKRINAVILLIIATMTFPAMSAEIGGVHLPDTYKTDRGTLVLNGGGIRTKMIIKAYVAGLYLTKKSSDYQKIIDADAPMAIKIIITTRWITSERFIEACEAGFQRTTNGNTKPLRDKIDLVYTVFKQEFNTGDVFDIVYEPKKGTSFYKNGKFISTQEGLALKRALFGIWIIDRPSHGCEDLRRGMLGLGKK
ncbi:MAG: chalcone isomerase family protein [Myxococcota bacterium]|nr:chalcone isomerase family protein [Myxococcota bacterium]